MATDRNGLKWEDLIGKSLDGRYRIDSVLGQGGMGMVFRATQTSMNRAVAVKTLHPELAITPQFFERFKREAEIASRLKHPNIITVFDFGQTPEGVCYFVMELVEGESLRQKVKREGPLSIEVAARIIEKVALGVSHAHQANVVHRDLKPHNIMVNVTPEGEQVKVLDFGLVKALEQEEEEALTSTGQVLGTPQYMPPEQAGGEHVDQRSDLYSLTAVFYFALTGTSPYNAKTVRQALSSALTKPVPLVSSHRPNEPVSAGIEEFVRRGLEREQADRYQTCEEFIEALHNAMASTDVRLLTARPPARPVADGAGSGSSPAPRRRARTASVVPELRRTAPDIPSLRSQSRRTNRVGITAFVISVIGAALALGSYVVLSNRPKADTATATAPAQLPTRPGEAVAPAPAPGAAASPTPAPMPQTVTITLRTTPPGAVVEEGGTMIGKTPLEMTWPRGEERTLSFSSPGFSNVSQSFRLERDEAFEITMIPVAKKPPKPTSSGKGPKPPTVPEFE